MIRRYFAEKDTTITNAFKANLIDRGEEANMGASDILEIFSIYGQTSTSSIEKSRILIQFPIDDIISDISSGLIPNSGVSYFLRLFNAKHSETLPRQFTLSAFPLSSSWEEGVGLDMETYRDEDEANWLSASLTSSWNTSGGDYLSSSFSSYFDIGNEDLEIDISTFVSNWISGTYQNNGILIKLSGSQEDGGDLHSYYTKKFFGRGSEFWFKRPIIEARWDEGFYDERGKFYASSSLAGSENINTIYFYNFLRGRLKNIPEIGTGSIYVKFFNSLTGSDLVSSSIITGTWKQEGIYIASCSLYTTESIVYDRWYNSSLSTCYWTGTINVLSFDNDGYNVDNNFVINILNMKDSYYSGEKNARFRIYCRPKNWSPNYYVDFSETPNSDIIEDMYYRVVRNIDGQEIVSYGTGSTNETRLSYDISGNYFDLDMSFFEKGYMYDIRFVFKDNYGTFREQKEIFKFRVE